MMNTDLYITWITKAYDMTAELVTPEIRRRAKMLLFALVYGTIREPEVIEHQAIRILQAAKDYILKGD